MSGNINFKRFDKSTAAEGFVYKVSENSRQLDEEFRQITMDEVGFNIHTTVKNYMAEAVLLGGNLRVNPTLIKSLRRDGTRPKDEVNNFVIITIYSSENSNVPDPKKRTTHTQKTEVRIPGKMLNQGSVFIKELDCYLMTESQLEATRELIARDVSHEGWDSVNVPSTMSKQDPAKVYVEFKELAQFCIQRQDKINIRVGIDLRYDTPPAVLKTMHIGILDSYFIPFSVYKLMYDPTLHQDEFVIENLHLASRDEFRSTWSELAQVGTMYLDHDEVKTMFGTFYGMGIFADKSHYLDYVFRRKTQERFRDETLYVANRSGDPRLKEEIDSLTRETLSLKEANVAKDAVNAGLVETNKYLKQELRSREETIVKLRDGHAEKMSAEVVIGEITNESKKLQNEELKLGIDAWDQAHRERTAHLNHRANTLKTVADILKSSWGIGTVCLTGVVSIAAVCRKYNLRVVMSK